jgi:hypothetical protein
LKAELCLENAVTGEGAVEDDRPVADRLDRRDVGLPSRQVFERSRLPQIAVVADRPAPGDAEGDVGAGRRCGAARLGLGKSGRDLRAGLREQAVVDVDGPDAETVESRLGDLGQRAPGRSR